MKLIILIITILLFSFSAFGQKEFRTITAQSGDTVASIAKRSGATANEVAKLNGLRVTSKLYAGSKIIIPVTLGIKPTQEKNGRVQVIVSFNNENAHDPYSLKYVRWGKVKQGYFSNEIYWSVYVKFRAKNAFGAYILLEQTFYIWNNKIVGVQ